MKSDYTNYCKVKEVEFIKEKIASFMRMPEQVFADIQIHHGQQSDDFLKGEMTVQIVGFIYANLVDERDLVFYCERPTFFDWLLRRKKVAKFHFKAKDLLLDPPKITQPTIRIYTID